MPNMVAKGSPPKGMVFIYFKYEEPFLAASRNLGYSNIWFKFIPLAETFLIGISRFTGCGTEYGINVTQDSAKKPVMINEAD